MNQFIDYLLRTEHLLAVAGVWILLSLFAKLLPRIALTRIYARIVPLLPIVLCSGAVWLPGIAQSGLGVGARIFLGIVLGALVGHAHKIFGQTVLGKDARL